MVVRALPRDLRVAPNALPDDTEDSIVGTQWHQEAVGAAAVALAYVAERRAASWSVYEEVALRGLFHRDGRPYTPRPDIYVLAAPLDPGLAEAALAEVGAPLLVVEIASESTTANDIGDKREAYAGAGVGEYLVFDPTGALIPGQIAAWRLGTDGRFGEWRPREEAWESKMLEVAFVVEGPFLRVRDRDGEMMPLARRALGLYYEAREQAREAREQAREAQERARQETEARRAAEDRAGQEAAARRQADERARQAEEALRVALERLRALDDA